jgi:hypothetical protein
MLAESRRMEEPQYNPRPDEPVEYNGGRPEPVTQQAYDGGVHSAPPSRESFGYSTGRPTPGRVVLSRDERDLARSCGVSETDWARGKVKMEQRRKAGLLQDSDG